MDKLILINIQEEHAIVLNLQIDYKNNLLKKLTNERVISKILAVNEGFYNEIKKLRVIIWTDQI